jgi:outer membrane protein
VESRSGRSARDVLQKSHERKVKELEQKRQELEELQKKYTTQKDLLNEKSRREMEQKIMDLSREYQELQLRAQMDIQKLDQELTQNILEELQPIVKKIAEEKGFDLILEKNEGGVVFRKEPLDITDLVLKQYDQSKEGDSSPRKK